MSRVRTRDQRSTVTGTYLKRYYPYGPTNYTVLTSAMLRGRYTSTTDVVGNRDGDNAFETNTSTRRFSTMDGDKWFNGRVTAELRNYPLYGTAQLTIPTSKYFSTPDFSARKLEWLARMQPGGTAFNVPLMLGEAAELPSLVTQFPLQLRKWARKKPVGRKPINSARAGSLAREFLADCGSLYLQGAFGYDPLMRDAVALLGVLAEVMKIFDQLAKLQNGGAIKRGLRLSSNRAVQELGSFAAHTNGFYVYLNQVRIYTEQSWVTSRWVPLIPAVLRRPESPQEMMDRAMRIALGLTPSGLAEAWWNLLPWSWLADWLADVQRYLNLLTGNAMLLKCESLCWCRTSTVDVYFACTSKPEWVTLNGDDFHQRVIKERIPLGEVAIQPPEPCLPALSGRQIAILLALLAQMMGGR